MAEAFENAFDDLFREGEGLADAGDWIRDNEVEIWTNGLKKLMTLVAPMGRM